MQWLIKGIVLSFCAATLTIFTVFMVLFIFNRVRYLKLWMVAMGLFTLAHLLDGFFVLGEGGTFLLIGYYLATTLAVFYYFLGTCAFFKHKLPLFLKYGFPLLFVLLLTFGITGIILPAVFWGFVLFKATMYIMIGWLFLKARYGSVNKFTGIVSILLGLYIVTFLFPPELQYWFILRGHLLETALTIVIALGMLISSFKRASSYLGRTQNALELCENKHYELYMNSPEAIVQLDNQGVIVDVNPAFENLFGYSKKEATGELLDALIAPPNFKETYTKTAKVFRKAAKELLRRKKDGSILYVSVIESPLIFKNEQVGKYVIYRDITEQRKAEERIAYLSFHDTLTGLYNRAFFEEELKRLDTERQLPLSIIMGDINGLKLINDTFGHNQGDNLLIKTAHLLQGLYRKEDIIARWGGDEFIMLLPKTEKEVALKIAARIRETCVLANEESKKMPLSIALGVASKNISSDKIEEVLIEADELMYQDKLLGGEPFKEAVISLWRKIILGNKQQTSKDVEQLKELALRLGKAVNLSPRRLEDLGLLVSLYDIGKIAMPDEIIDKKEPLTPEEWAKVKKHPETGYSIAQLFPELVSVSGGILAHHEHYDGSGYPRHLKGEEISLIARIFAVAKAYHTMKLAQPSQKTRTQRESLEELKKGAGTLFDPALVEIFIDIINKERGVVSQ